MGKVIHINPVEGLHMTQLAVKSEELISKEAMITEASIASEESMKNVVKIILYFANNSPINLYKTKLHKLLFYVQFLFFKTYRQRLINENFIRDSFGPVMNNLDFYLDLLDQAKIIECLNTRFGTVIIPNSDVYKDDYSKKEMKILEKVQKKFGSNTAQEISEYSHREPLWINTSPKQIIPLSGADLLNAF